MGKNEYKILQRLYTHLSKNIFISLAHLELVELENAKLTIWMLMLMVEVGSRRDRHSCSPFISPTLPTKLPGQKKWQTHNYFRIVPVPVCSSKTGKVSTSLGLFLGELDPPTPQHPDLTWAGSTVRPSDGAWGFGRCGWEVTWCACLSLPFTLGGPHAVSLTPMSDCI